MKIAVNINELTLKQNTGVKTYTREIVGALLQIDRENEYILHANCREQKFLFPTMENSKFKIQNSKFNLPFWTYAKLPQEIKKDRPDVLFMPIQAVPFFKKPKNLKIVVTVHDLAFLLFPDHFTRKDRFLLNFHTKRAVRMADKIIAPSEATKKDIVKFYGINEDKIKVIWHGVKTSGNSSFCHCEEERRSNPEIMRANRNITLSENSNGIATLRYRSARNDNYNNSFSHPYILFVGSIQPRKNITGLIEAFETVKENRDLHICHSDRSERGTSERSGGICKRETLTSNENNLKNTFYPLTDPSARSYRRSVGMTVNALASLKLVICGGRGWMADEIYKRAKESKFSKDIIFTGSVSDEERDEFYKNALIFALPSFYEGFGLPVLEAMSYGVPCVVGDNSSLSEIAGNSALLVDANNSADIAEKINLLLSNSELRKDLAQRGIENVKRFSWDKAGEKTLEVFVNV